MVDITSQDTGSADYVQKKAGIMDYLSEVEPEIHPYFDLVLFKQRTKQIIAGK